MHLKVMKQFIPIVMAFLGSCSAGFSQNTYTRPIGPFGALFDGELIEADYWDTVPRILSAGVGFCDIVGIDANQIDQNTTLYSGGAWLSDISCGSNTADFTTVSLKNQVQNIYIFQNEAWALSDSVIGLDGLPIVFSWPVFSNTIDVTDFRFILNTGDTVMAYMAGPWPNIENNERNCVVVYGEFANRKPSTNPDSRFPVRVEIVDDGSPLFLAGPNGQIVSAVGLSWQTNSSPYDPNNGPRLVGAKLNHIGAQTSGEGSNNLFLNNIAGYLPNNELDLYGGGDFRLRMLTSGGFSPDGVRGIRPDEFARYFRLHAIAPDGSTMLLEHTDTVYSVMGGNLKILGMSDLGRVATSYDDCYDEDRDNYIDIILEGDEAAARNITFLEIPSLAGGYDALYNPGGPGTTPFPNISYTSPGPADLEPVIMALDDPWRVTADASFLSAKEFSNQDLHTFTVYPNPAINEIHLSAHEGFDGHYEIVDTRGRLLLNTTDSTINISSFKPGAYVIIKRFSDGNFSTSRFLKF